MRAIIVVAFMLTISFSSIAQSVVYVNDTLRVGVRDQPVSSGAKKVSTVKTGEALEVLDTSDSKYYKVKTPAGRIGWVSRAYVSGTKPAFMRLEIANEEIEALKEQLLSVEGSVESVETQFDQVQELNLSLEGDLSRLKEANTQLQSEIDEIRGSALIPDEYQAIALIAGVLVLLILGFVVGVFHVRSMVRTRLGGLDI